MPLQGTLLAPTGPARIGHPCLLVEVNQSHADMPRDEIVAYLERYAASFSAPVHEGVRIKQIASKEGDSFVVGTNDGDYRAKSLVLATGAFQRPHRPAKADTLPVNLLQIDSGGYTSPSELPPGDVLGDARYEQLMELVPPVVEKHGLTKPDIASPAPFNATAPDDVDLASFGTVLFTGGFRPDFRSWLPWTDAFDDQGFPIQRDGASTVVDSLYFVGSHFLRKRKSSLLIGVGEDAQIVARALAN